VTIRIYVYIWIVFALFLSYEYSVLNGVHLPSALLALEARGKIPFKVTPDPGRSLSLWLGWTGLSLMLVMNLYSLRKRTAFLNGVGKLSAWLNFHVFCGLLGPTFILFHCNFKVRGLVAISFWSMVVSFSSGIIGRYFYLQLVMKKGDFTREGEKWVSRLQRYLAKSKIQWDEAAYAPFLQEALVVAGVPSGAQRASAGSVAAFWSALAGDLRLRFRHLDIPEEWPANSEIAVRAYAVSMRKAATLENFQRLMGYWHAFHFPFAVFMYLAAVIHVTASLIFAF
jgi:hypothetical protein